MTAPRFGQRGNTLLRAALWYAKWGDPVLPLWWPTPDGGCACGKPPGGQHKAAKHPLGILVARGLRDATSDPELIARWWRRFPQANVGLRCDRRTRLDVDERNGGEDTLGVLLSQHGPLPPTPEVLTGGGRHIVLQAIPGMNKVTLGPGLEFLSGQGCYVVAPPSRHISGRSYLWKVSSRPTDVAVASCPEEVWLHSGAAAGSGVPQRGGSPSGSGGLAAPGDRSGEPAGGL